LLKNHQHKIRVGSRVDNAPWPPKYATVTAWTCRSHRWISHGKWRL